MCCIAGKAGMLPHTGLFLLWKVALQIRIRRRLKSINCFFRRPLRICRIVTALPSVRRAST